MRCTRCDRIIFQQGVGRTPGGQLVFGWCPACLAECGCRVEGARVPRSQESIRRVGVAWVGGLLMLWGAVMLLMGLVRRADPMGGAGSFYRGGGASLAAVGALLAASSALGRGRVRMATPRRSGGRFPGRG